MEYNDLRCVSVVKTSIVGRIVASVMIFFALCIFPFSSITGQTATAVAVNANPCPNSGEIRITVSGLTAPYIFDLYTTSNTSIGRNNTGIFVGLSSGSYKAYVYDSGTYKNEPVVTNTVVVSNPVYYTLSIYDYEATTTGNTYGPCKPNGRISVEVEGGAGPYTYILDRLSPSPLDGYRYANSEEDHTLVSFDTLSEGTYQVRVQDYCGNYITSPIGYVFPDPVLADKTISTFTWGGDDTYGKFTYTYDACTGSITGITPTDFYVDGTTVTVVLKEGGANINGRVSSIEYRTEIPAGSENFSNWITSVDASSPLPVMGLDLSNGAIVRIQVRNPCNPENIVSRDYTLNIPDTKYKVYQTVGECRVLVGYETVAPTANGGKTACFPVEITFYPTGQPAAAKTVTWTIGDFFAIPLDKLDPRTATGEYTFVMTDNKGYVATKQYTIAANTITSKVTVESKMMGPALTCNPTFRIITAAGDLYPINMPVTYTLTGGPDNINMTVSRPLFQENFVLFDELPLGNYNLLMQYTDPCDGALKSLPVEQISTSKFPVSFNSGYKFEVRGIEDYCNQYYVRITQALYRDANGNSLNNSNYYYYATLLTEDGDYLASGVRTASGINFNSSPVGPGKYRVRVSGYPSSVTGNSEYNGKCFYTENIIDIPRDTIGIDMTISGGVICEGSTTGSLTVMTAGPRKPFSYRIKKSADPDENYTNWVEDPDGDGHYEFTGLQEGNYTIQVKNTCGYVESQAMSLQPVASVRAIQTTNVMLNNQVCEGSDVMLQLVAMGPVSNPVWKIPGGETFSGATLIIQDFSTTDAGEYEVTFTTINGCTVTNSINLVFAPRPGKPTDIVGSSPACGSGVAHEYTVASDPDVSYVWSVTGGVGINGESTSNKNAITWEAGAISHKVGVQYQDQLGCRSLITEKSVTVEEPATVNAGPDQVICSNSLARLSGAASNYQSVHWTGGQGVFSPSRDVLDPTYTPAISEYNTTVVLTLTATPPGTACSAVSDAVNIRVQQLPVITMKVPRDTVFYICQNEVMPLNNSLIDTTDALNYIRWFKELHPGRPTFAGGVANQNSMSAHFAPEASDAGKTYPIYVEIAGYGVDRPCGYIRDSIMVSVVTADILPLEASFEVEPQKSQDICGDTVYVVKVKNHRASPVHNVTFSFRDVYASLIGIKDTIISVEYPYGSGITVDYNGENPTEGVFNFTLIDELQAEDSLRVFFRAGPRYACDFVSGFTFDIVLDARSWCGDNLTDKKLTSKPYNVTLFDGMEFNEYEMSVPLPKTYFDVRDTIVTFTFKAKNTNPGASGENENGVLYVPPGGKLIKESFKLLKNPIDTTDIEEWPGLNGGIDYYFPIPEGIVQGDSIYFTVDVDIREVPCDANMTFYAQVLYLVEHLSCPGLDPLVACEPEANLGTAMQNITISRYSAVPLEVDPSSGVMNGHWSGAITFRTPTVMYAGDEISVNFYADVNSSNTLDPEDTWLYATTYITKDKHIADTFVVSFNNIPILEPYQYVIHISAPELCVSQEIPMILVTGPDTICGEVDVTFRTAPGMKNYVWDAVSGATLLEGGGVDDNYVIFKFVEDDFSTLPADKEVRVSYAREGQEGLRAGAQKEIHVLPHPVAVISSDTTICMNQVLRPRVINVSDPDYTPVQWSGGENLGTWINATQVDAAYIPNTLLRDTTVMIFLTVAGGEFCGNVVDTMMVRILAEVPQAVSLSANDMTICPNGAVLLSASGNTSDFYYWYRDGLYVTRTIEPAYGTDQPGAWQVALGNGVCTSRLSIPIYLQSVDNTITQPVIKASGTVLCGGVELELTAPEGMLSYEWYRNGAVLINPHNTLKVSTPGSYAVMVSNNSCPGPSLLSAPVEIFASSTLETPKLKANTLEICNNDSIQLHAEPLITPGHYQWYKNGALLKTTTTNTCKVYGHGNYTVVLNNGSCTSPESNAVSLVSVAALSNPTIIATSPILCNNGTVVLKASVDNMFRYQWYKDGVLQASTRNNFYLTTEPGTWKVRTENYTGCITPQSAPVAVSSSNLPKPVITSDHVAACDTGYITLTATPAGMAAYRWYRNNTLINVTLENHFSLFVTPDVNNISYEYGVITQNYNGCESPRDFIEIDIKPRPHVEIAANDPSLCGAADGSIILSGMSPNVVYTISYTKDGVPVADADYTADVAGEIVLTGLTKGDYTDIALRPEGCPVGQMLSIELNDPPLPVVNVGEDFSVCINSSISLNPSVGGGQPPYGYSWTGPGSFSAMTKSVLVTNNATAANSGDYILSVKDMNQCVGIDTVNIQVASPPTIKVTGDTTKKVCMGTAMSPVNFEIIGDYATARIVFTAGEPGGLTYNDNSTLLVLGGVPATAGTFPYMVYTENTSGCKNDTIRATLTVLPLPTLNMNTLVACENAQISKSTLDALVTSNGTVSYYTDNTYTTLLPFPVELTKNKKIYVESEDIYHCEAFDTFPTDVQPAPVISITVSPLIIQKGASAVLTATGADTYVWSPGGETSASIRVSPTITTLYTVTGTNNNTGCSASATDSVFVDPISVPNVITPNGDGLNDTFVIDGLEVYSENELFIYNRWMTLVYYKKNYSNDWMGDKLTAGVYFYRFKAKMANGEVSERTGYIQLVR